MSTRDEVSYLLPRDAPESARLDRQFELYTKLIGCVLHPDIVTDVKNASVGQNATPVKVADVGSGTGAFIYAMSQQLPSSVGLIGLDISDAQFPKANECPPSCSFAVLNILDPIPETYRNKFDAVHVRLLSLGLSGTQWGVAARNMMDMLKPGGWLQWLEPNSGNTLTCQTDPVASIARLEKLGKIFRDACLKVGKFVDQGARLEEVISNAGYVDIRLLVYGAGQVPELRPALTAITKGVIMGTLSMIAQKGVDIGTTPEDLAVLSRQCDEDIASGKVYWQWPVEVVVARKPRHG